MMGLCRCSAVVSAMPDEKGIGLSSNPNVGDFVSRAKERLRNALNGVNGGTDSLCAGRWLTSYLFVTANR
jgi:hypothetical protein